MFEVPRREGEGMRPFGGLLSVAFEIARLPKDRKKVS